MAYDPVTRPASDGRDETAEPASESGAHRKPTAEIVQQYRAIFASLPPETRAHLEEEMAEWRRPGWRERYDQELDVVKRRRSR